jgi:hypothetical protein
MTIEFNLLAGCLTNEWRIIMTVMKKRNVYFVLLSCLLVFYFAASSVHALDDTDSLQCDGGIISAGDTKFQVQQKCGEPTSKEGMGNVWIYNFGSSQFVYYITFIGNQVERIQTGGYGD